MSTTTEAIDLETILPWSKPKRIDTKNGPRDVSKCLLKRDEPYTEKFWALWRNAEHKKTMVIAGISVGKEWSNGQRDREGAEWEATFWRLPPKAELQRLETSMESSGAIDAPPDLIIPCSDGLAYLGYQRGGIAYALQRPGTLFGDDMGLGKSQPLTARVLTPSGWKLMGDIRIGDEVTNSGGSACSVTGIYPQGVLDIYDVEFTDGSKTQCSDDHLWAVNTPVRNRRGNKLMVKPLREIRQQLRDAAGNLRYFVPIVGPVGFHSAPLPLPPYLLGIMLGDGTFKYNYTRFSTNDADIVARMTAERPEGVEVKHVNGPDWGFVSPHSGAINRVRRALKDLHLHGLGSDDKFVPTIYKQSRHTHREALLQGLLDSDGYVSQDGTVQFSSNSKALADDVTFIVRSLGGITRTTSKLSASFKLHYIVTISLPKGVRPFHCKRKADRYRNRVKYPPARGIKSVTYAGRAECQCIAVNSYDHLYVTDDFIVTHNTIQAIGFINTKADIKKVVVVCPASVKINWYRELKKWLTRHFTVRIAEPDYWPTADIVIINYDILHRFADRLAEPIDCAIADEAQFIKNEKTKRGQAMLAMGKASKYRLALTGTPMENDEAEVFTIAQFCDPVEYNNRFMFLRKYTGSEENRKKCQRKLRSTIMVRRLKTEVLKDLPPKFRTVIEVPYDDDELKEFERIATRGVDAERLEELKAALELAKASDRFEDYEAAVEALKEGVSTKFEMMSELRHRTAKAALPYCIDHLKNVFESGVKKVIFFSHHRDINDAIHAAFDGSVQHYGGMSDAEKQQAVDRFQQDEHCPLFSGSIRASGVGLTLTAASRVVFGELDWVPGRMTQAEDRAHRIGQTDNVNVDVLVLEGSFFATMAKRIVEKQVAIDQALDEDRTMLMQEPIVVIPQYKEKAPKPISTSRKEMIERSATMDPATVAAVHECLKRLARVCDGALALDNVGFNGCDSHIGKSLAAQAKLSPLQAVLGSKILRKYAKSQLAGFPHLEAALRTSKQSDETE